MLAILMKVLISVCSLGASSLTIVAVIIFMAQPKPASQDGKDAWKPATHSSAVQKKLDENRRRGEAARKAAEKAAEKAQLLQDKGKGNKQRFSKRTAKAS